MKVDISPDRPAGPQRDPSRPTPRPTISMLLVAPLAILGIAMLFVVGGIMVLALIAAGIGTYLCHTGAVPAYKCGDSRPAAPPPPRDVDLRIEWVKAIDKTTYAEHPESCWADPNLDVRVLFRNDGTDQVDHRSVQVKLVGTSNDSWGLKSVRAETTALGAVGTGIGTKGDGYGVGMLQVTVPPDLRDKPLVLTATVVTRDDRNQDNNSMSLVIGRCS